MTYDEREEMFSKDVLTAADLQKLLGISKTYAYEIMRKIKAKSDRLGIDGKIHTQDYLDYYNLPQSDRYNKMGERETDKVIW